MTMKWHICALMEFAVRSNYEECKKTLKALVNEDGYVDTIDLYNHSAIWWMWVIRNQNEDILRHVQYLAAKDINIYDEKLSKACLYYNNVQLLEFLIQNGDDHVYDNLVPWAIKKGELNILKFLVDAGADIHVGNERALCVAAERGLVTIVEYLLEKGANISVNDYHPLKLAAENRHIYVVNYLINAGEECIITPIELVYLYQNDFISEIKFNEDDWTYVTKIGDIKCKIHPYHLFYSDWYRLTSPMDNVNFNIKYDIKE